MAGMIRVAIVDDHPATAQGLADLLAHEADIEVVGTAISLTDARALLERESPDVALVDIVLDGQPRGFELLTGVGGRRVPRVIVFSSFDRTGFHGRALELGARGFLPKTAPIEEIVSAVRVVAAGGTHFRADALDDARGAPRPPSGRELEVIAFVADGYSNDEIGIRLGITEKSVESHLRRLFARYGLVTRTDLAMLAVRQAWIDPSNRPRRA